MPAMETEIPSPRSEPVSETVMPERLLSETGAAVFTERLGMRVFLGIAARRSLPNFEGAVLASPQGKEEKGKEANGGAINS